MALLKRIGIIRIVPYLDDTYSNSFGHVDYWKNKGGDSSSTRYSNSFTSVPGICYKSEKVSDDTNSGNRISGNDNLALPQKKIQSIKKMFSDMYQNSQTILLS